MLKTIIVFLFIFLCCPVLPAKEIHYLGRSPQALLRGDAFTALADDEYTLFYNPGALGSHHGVSISTFNPDIGLTSVMDQEDQDRFKDFPDNDAAKIAERVMGFPIYLHAGIFPSIKMESFGLSLFASLSNSFILRNAIHPVLSMEYLYDRGFVAGYAHSFGDGGKRVFRHHKWHRITGPRTSVGLAVKHINRSALVEDFDFFGTKILNAIANPDNNDFSKIRDQLGYGEGEAWGVDAGTQMMYATQNSDISMGFSIMDIGDTRYKHRGGTKKVPKQDMRVNWGTAFSQDFGFFDYTFSFDLHPLSEDIDFGRKVHLGFDFGILSSPGIRVHAGWNAGYVSYGATIDLWIFRLTAGFYTVELGTKYKEQPGKRGLIYLSLFNFSFEP